MENKCQVLLEIMWHLFYGFVTIFGQLPHLHMFAQIKRKRIIDDIVIIWKM